CGRQQCYRRNRRRLGAGLERHAGNPIPREGGVESALSNFLHVDRRGQWYVGLDATMLRALAGDAIELPYGDCQLPARGLLRPTVERHEILHGALAESALADDHAAMIVLDGAGENLRSGRAETVDEDCERAVI